MERRTVGPEEYAPALMRALPRGVLLTSRAGEKTNAMVIGWGTVGINWGRPVFAAYVREGRHTRALLDENPEFTVNIPLAPPKKEVIGVCGGRSGRDLDKFAAAGLTPVPALKVSVPAIREFPLTLECRVLYRQKQELSLLGEDIRAVMYPQDVPGSVVGANRDAHVTYFGEILAAYVLE